MHLEPLSVLLELEIDGVGLRIDAGDRIGLASPDDATCSALIDRIEQAAREADTPCSSYREPPDFGQDSVRRAVSPELSRVAELERDAHQVTEARADPTADIELLESELARLREEYDALGGVALRRQVHEVLFGLGFAEADLRRSASKLRPSEQHRLTLASQLCRQPELLLLDRPERHLDTATARWLARYLSRWPGALVIASCDLPFLQQIVDQLMTLENGRPRPLTPSRRIPIPPATRRTRRVESLVEQPAPDALDDAALIARLQEFEARYERVRDLLARQDTYQQPDAQRKVAALTAQFEAIEEELMALYRVAEERSLDRPGPG